MSESVVDSVATASEATSTNEQSISSSSQNVGEILPPEISAATEESLSLDDEDDDEGPIRLADESGSESCDNIHLQSGGCTSTSGGPNRSHSSSSDNFTDARMDTPDNDENASSICLPSIPSELQLDSLPFENGNGGGGGDVTDKAVSIAKIDEIDEDFKTPDVEFKTFGNFTADANNASLTSSIPPPGEGACSEVIMEETPELCKSGSIHADLENLEDYGDEQFVSDVGESIQVKNVEVDVIKKSSSSEAEKIVTTGGGGGGDAPPKKKSCEEEEEDEDDDFSESSSVINSIDRGTESESSPHSPSHDYSQRRRSSSCLQQTNIKDGDVFPDEQILDYLVDVNDDVK